MDSEIKINDLIGKNIEVDGVLYKILFATHPIGYVDKIALTVEALEKPF